MEIVVTARHTELTPRFRRHLEEKLSKVGQLAPRAIRLEVGVSHETNKRQADTAERIELTLLGKGPVVRAEACADDPYVALDLATTKLMERLRRAVDRKKVHHGRHHPLPSVRDGSTVPVEPDALTATGLAADGTAPDGPVAGPAPAAAPAGASAGAPAGARGEPTSRPLTSSAGDPDGDIATEYTMGSSPVVIRDKVHVAEPMSLDDALLEMELVGHDFYLFIDAHTACPSVVYRRRGWSYGVIRLAGDADQAAAVAAAVAQLAAGSGAPSATVGARR